MKSLLPIWAVCALVACVAGCDKKPPPRVVNVYAAASLQTAFTAIADDLKQSDPQLEIRFQFAGSQELRTQIEQGAPADVFASADERHASLLVNAGKLEAPQIFAKNRAVVIVGDRETRVKTIDDLPAVDRLVVGETEVPIGKYTAEIFAKVDAKTPGFGAKAAAKIVSRETSVSKVVQRVALGEADAGIVYRTDAIGKKGIVAIEIPDDVNVVASYPIAVCKGAPHSDDARRFVDRVRSPEGAAILARFGFAP